MCDAMYPKSKRLKTESKVACYSIKPNDVTSENEPMKIIVVPKETHKGIILDVKSPDTIKSVKKRIEQEEDIGVTRQRLRWKGKEVQDDYNLAHYGIEGMSILELTYTINIFIENSELKQRSNTISFENSDDIESVKIKIQELNGIPPDRQRLIYKGKQLKEGKTLTHYKIQNESVLEWKETMKIKVLSGFTTHESNKNIEIILDVNVTDAILDVKKEIALALLIEYDILLPPAQQSLIYGGIELENDQTISLSRYKIRQDFELELQLKPDDVQVFFMKILTGSNQSVDQQRLIFSGQRKKRKSSFSDYNIYNKSTMHVVLRLRPLVAFTASP